jgi:tetratricopeptide (TPR) repeat protein
MPRILDWGVWASTLLSKIHKFVQVVVCAGLWCLPLCSQASQPADQKTSGTAFLRIIVVSSPEQAQQIVSRLNKGEDFADVARKESIDSTAADGGSLGTVAISSLRPELRDALAGLGPGQISPIVKSPLGFAILKVDTEPDATPRAGGTGSAIVDSIGSVKASWGLGGLVEAEVGLYNFPKPPGWDRDPKKICEIRKQSLAHEKEAMERFFAPANSKQRESFSSLDLLNTYYSFGEIYSYLGDMERAIPQYEKAYQIASTQETAAQGQMDESLGVAYLHKSEMENGVFRTPGDRCLLPMKPSSMYTNKEDSRKSIEYLLKALDQQPDNLEVKWLLNVAYMTIGGYPDQVSTKYLIPLKAFESSEDIGRFRDVAPEAGLDSFAMAGGVIVDDFENIGRFDIVTSSFDSCGPMHFFHNNGDGTFTEQAAKAGLSDQMGGLNMLQTDYNNDGCIDMLILRGAWELPQRKSLLRNNCDGTFTDVTVASGLDQPTSTQAAVWVDVNNDGLLDLFVGNEGQPLQLFLNKGDGTFQDISESAGLHRTMFTKGVAAGDYDNDGFPDLYVSNFSGGNVLFHNNHNNTFTDVTQAAGVPGPGRGFATWFFDYDNDGLPDIFATSYFLSLDETARTYLSLPHNAATLKLYKNLGSGTFRDVTQEVILDKVYMPMGANFGDIDNDGFPDIFLGTGTPSYVTEKPSVLLHNQGGKRFVDVTTSSGTGEWHRGHAVAFADLDNRGDEDIIFEVGGATPGDSHALRVFENPGHGNDWISLKLVGTKTNRPAIGARVKVTVENKGQGTRSIYRTVGSGGSFGASPLQQHIGLGKDARILDLEVWWPTGNTCQHFSNVQKNQFLEIKEFAQQYAKLDRKPYRLGGSKRNSNVVAKQPGDPPATTN